MLYFVFDDDDVFRQEALDAQVRDLLDHHPGWVAVPVPGAVATPVVQVDNNMGGV